VTERMSAKDFREIQNKQGSNQAGGRKHKYNAKPKVVDGIRFDSTLEADRYVKILWEIKTGAIRDLELQVSFDLVVNGILIARYISDFRYKDAATGETVVEDAKGFKTAEYKMKKALMKAVNGIDIRETYKKHSGKRR